MAAYVTLLLLFMATTYADDLVTTDLDDEILTSRCRSMCSNQFVGHPDSDAACLNNTDCYLCWYTCDKHTRDDFAATCRAQDTGNEGLQAACEFIQKVNSSLYEDQFSDVWIFPEKIFITILSDSMLTVSWLAAERHIVTDIDTYYPVYTLLWKSDDHIEWTSLLTTTKKWAEITGPRDQYVGLTFLLLAVTPGGVVTKDLSSHWSDEEHNTMIDDTQSTYYADLKVTVGVKVTTSEKSILVHATLRQLVGVDAGSAKEYNVFWGRDSCRIIPVLPECQLPSVTDMMTITSTEQDVTFVLGNLTYNSLYWIQVESTSPDGSTSINDPVYFYTPWCSTPEGNLTICGNHQTSDLRNGHKNEEMIQPHHHSSRTLLYISLGVCLVICGLVLTLTLIAIKNTLHLDEIFSEKRQQLLEKSKYLRRRIRDVYKGVTTIRAPPSEKTSTPSYSNGSSLSLSHSLGSGSRSPIRSMSPEEFHNTIRMEGETSYSVELQYEERSRKRQWAVRLDLECRQDEEASQEILMTVFERNEDYSVVYDLEDSFLDHSSLQPHDLRCQRTTTADVHLPHNAHSDTNGNYILSHKQNGRIPETHIISNYDYDTTDNSELCTGSKSFSFDERLSESIKRTTRLL